MIICYLPPYTRTWNIFWKGVTPGAYNPPTLPKVTKIPSSERSHIPPKGKRKIIDSKVFWEGDMLLPKVVAMERDTLLRPPLTNWCGLMDHMRFFLGDCCVLFSARLLQGSRKWNPLKICTKYINIYSWFKNHWLTRYVFGIAAVDLIGRADYSGAQEAPKRSEKGMLEVGDVEDHLDGLFQSHTIHENGIFPCIHLP